MVLRFEPWQMVEEDPMSKLQTSLEDIAEMQQIFHQISLSNDRSIYPTEKAKLTPYLTSPHQIKELDSAFRTHLS